MNYKHFLSMSAVSLLLASCGNVHSGGESAANANLSPVEQYIKASFLPGENQELDRLKQDDTIKACNQYNNQPPTEVAAAIIEREKKAIKYPADGKLMGDWKEGEKYFKEGFAYRIGRLEPDNPKKDRGGNCYACHSGDKKEIAYGTIGPMLTGYGKVRGTSEAVVKYTYEKIYNSQSVLPCSHMPRLGHNGILTPEKVAHITAYLLSPESPVNQ